MQQQPQEQPLAGQELQVAQAQGRKLTKKDVHWKWTGEAETYVIKRYAEFLSPTQIATDLMQDMVQYLEPDLARYGSTVLRGYLLKRIYDLRPQDMTVRQKFQPLFDGARKKFLEGVNATYLAHRRNRLTELDQLYQLVMSKAMDPELTPADLKGYVMTATKVLAEARSEMSSSRVGVEATLEDGNAKLTLQGNIDSLTDGQIKELMDKHERGEPITVSGNGTSSESGTGGDVPPAGTGTPETEQETEQDAPREAD